MRGLNSLGGDIGSMRTDLACSKSGSSGKK